MTEKDADKLYQEGKFKEAAEEYAKLYSPFRGLTHLMRLAKKQTTAMRELFKKEPK